MANFTKVDNALLESLVLSDLNGSEFRIVLFLIRETAGFHRDSVKLTVDDIARSIGLSTRNVYYALKRLKNKGIVVVNGSQYSAKPFMQNPTKNTAKFGKKSCKDLHSPIHYNKENKENKETVPTHEEKNGGSDNGQFNF